jgi:hypothetical protein
MNWLKQKICQTEITIGGYSRGVLGVAKEVMDNCPGHEGLTGGKFLTFSYSFLGEAS